MSRVNPFCVLLVSLLMLSPARADQPVLPDLRDLNLKGWGCANDEDGQPRSAADAARNRMKNRRWIAVTNAVPQWTCADFVKHGREFDLEIGAASRRKLASEQAERLALVEKQIVSVTGWLVLTYPGPPESCNCGSAEFHDWHLELLAQPLDHVPHTGDPTAIICEVTPRTESAIYRSGVRLQKLAAFIRQGQPPQIKDFPTGGVAHKVRVTGYLLWDDSHNQPQKDIGQIIATGGGNEYHHPWRATAWEIHPILKIEDLGTKE